MKAIVILLLTLRLETWKEKVSCTIKYQDIGPVISCIGKAANVDDKSPKEKDCLFCWIRRNRKGTGKQTK